MAETKKITVSIPNSLLEEVDLIVSIEKQNRNEFVKEAMRLYIREKRRLHICEMLKYGYMEMSQINLALAESGLEQDMVELDVYESILNGREKP
ncbi:MAG: CopG family transcriptional regulator [Tissierellia bacterium]|nr:CopG family transcriptional regulator [Tissierellia bacterium]